MRPATVSLTAAALLLAAPAFAQPAAEAELTRLAKCTTHLAALSVLSESSPDDQRLKPFVDRMNPLLPRLGARFESLRATVGAAKAEAISDRVFADAEAQIEAIVEASDPAAALVANHGGEIEACLVEVENLPA